MKHHPRTEWLEVIPNAPQWLGATSSDHTNAELQVPRDP
jgi:hypothetical protein